MVQVNGVIEEGGWGLKLLFDWVTDNYVRLLQLIPQMVTSYQMVDENDATVMRYAIIQVLLQKTRFDLAFLR